MGVSGRGRRCCGGSGGDRGDGEVLRSGLRND